METIRQTLASFFSHRTIQRLIHNMRSLIDVPIGGAVCALKTLGDKLGINLINGVEREAGMPSKL